MLAIDKSEDVFLYRQVIDLIAEHIATGTLGPGDRLPSLRKMSQSTGVSVPTVGTTITFVCNSRRFLINSAEIIVEATMERGGNGSVPLNEIEKTSL